MARTAEPPLTVIVDPDDDLGCLEELRRLHARPYGQILCEPDPTATSADLARYLLEALGKQAASLTRRQLWALVDCHLRAERVRELVVARAHTLTFPALRDLANHAHDAAGALWLLTAGERPSAAIFQLLEARPHNTATVEHLIDHWRDASPASEPDPVPPGAGADYPYLTYRTPQHITTRARLCAGLRGAQRAAVAETWDSAVQWTNTWLQENPQGTKAQLADALYRLTWAGDTGSELLVRAQAALDTIDRARIVVNREVVASSLTVAWGETRPYQWRQCVHRAAALADHFAEPQVAAVIALGVIYRHPATVRRAFIGGTAPDGSIVANDWANRCAVPPPLRRALATQRNRLTPGRAAAQHPLLPGTTHGRMSTQEIEDIFAQLELPESLWKRIDEPFEPPDQDGRSILSGLNAVDLFDVED